MGIVLSHPFAGNEANRWGTEVYEHLQWMGSCLLPIDDGLTNATNGIAKVDGVGLAEVLDGEDLFFCFGVGGKDVTALDAGEQAAIDGRREEAAILFDKDVVNGAFGDLVVNIQKQDIVIACLGCGPVRLSVEKTLGGLVEVHGVARVGALGGDADAQGLGGGCGDGLIRDVQMALGVEEKTDFAGRF